MLVSSGGSPFRNIQKKPNPLHTRQKHERRSGKLQPRSPPNPEKRARLCLRSDLALQDPIWEIRHFLLILCSFLRSVLAEQDRILTIWVLASLGKGRSTLFGYVLPCMWGLAADASDGIPKLMHGIPWGLSASSDWQDVEWAAAGPSHSRACQGVSDTFGEYGWKSDWENRWALIWSHSWNRPGEPTVFGDILRASPSTVGRVIGKTDGPLFHSHSWNQSAEPTVLGDTPSLGTTPTPIKTTSMVYLASRKRCDFENAESLRFSFTLPHKDRGRTG